jgi:hypothetical protein
MFHIVKKRQEFGALRVISANFKWFKKGAIGHQKGTAFGSVS